MKERSSNAVMNRLKREDEKERAHLVQNSRAEQKILIKFLLVEDKTANRCGKN